MIGVVVGFAAEASLAAGLGGPVAVGVDAAGTAEAALGLLRHGVRGLLSFGLAGGLDPGLKAGHVVVPLHVIAADGATWPTNAALSGQLGDPGSALLAAETVLASRAAKHDAFVRTGAVAVDMESGIVACVAAKQGVPFAVLRVVCDPARRDLPPAALTAIGADGRIRPGALVRSLARQPGQIGALVALGRDAARARAALLARVAVIGRIQ